MEPVNSMPRFRFRAVARRGMAERLVTVDSADYESCLNELGPIRVA